MKSNFNVTPQKKQNSDNFSPGYAIAGAGCLSPAHPLDFVKSLKPRYTSMRMFEHSQLEVEDRSLLDSPLPRFNALSKTK